MSDPSGLRVADADREQLAEELREHMLAGQAQLGGVRAAPRAGLRGHHPRRAGCVEGDLPLSPRLSARRCRAQNQAPAAPGAGDRRGGGLWHPASQACGWPAAHGAFWPGWVILVTRAAADAQRLAAARARHPTWSASKRHLDERRRARWRASATAARQAPPRLPR